MAAMNAVVARLQGAGVCSGSLALFGSVARQSGRLGFNVAPPSFITLRPSSPARFSVVSKAQNDAGDSLRRNTGNAARSTVYSGKGTEEKINLNRAQLAYVIVYAPDVNEAADFYSKAFGLEIRPQNKSNSWVEMETGATTLAFTPEKQHETQLTGGLSSSNSNKVVLNLDFSDVEAAYKHAISQGATAVAEPEEKNWPQKVGYVKDLNENIVRLGSFPDL